MNWTLIISTIIYLAGWGISVLTLLVIPRQRDPGAAQAWLLFIFLIDQATAFVHLVMYVFADDTTGQRVADALCRASRPGVRCQVPVDGLGSRNYLRTPLPRLRAAGIEGATIAAGGCGWYPPGAAHVFLPGYDRRWR